MLELVTSIILGYANDYDGHKLKKLVEKDEGKGIEVGTLAGDKGYDDGDNHYYLEQREINSAIRLNSYRTQNEVPLSLRGLLAQIYSSSHKPDRAYPVWHLLPSLARQG